MKKLIIIFVMSLFALQMFAQQTPVETVTIKKSDLTDTQLAKIAMDEQLAKIQTYGNWVGAGKEVGIAVKEALLAVVDVADKFGNTKVGQLTMYMVTWKVIGKDFVRIFLGLLFIIFSTTLIFKNLRKMYPYRIAKKTNGLKFWLPTEYDIIKPERYEGFELVKIIYLVLLCGSFGITFAIMFS